MTKANIRKIIAVVTIIMLIAINSSVLAAEAYSASISLTSNSKLKEGDTVTVNVNLASVNGANLPAAIEMIVGYDQNVFETLTASDFKSTSDWSFMGFSDKSNKATALKNTAGKAQDNIVTITFKVKSSISVDSTKITLSQMEYSEGATSKNGTGAIYPNDTSIIISREKAAESTTENTTKNDEITISKNNNTTSSTTKNTVANDNTTAKKTLPKTGLQEYGVIAIVVVAIVGTFSYFVYKRIAKDVK